jgi:hypothetical protein
MSKASLYVSPKTILSLSVPALYLHPACKAKFFIFRFYPAGADSRRDNDNN